ncbi:exopolysaccharide biosynthesis polyprenyl glycosylphosphotransferase [Patulibacter minatonensis]|uniref:exopolysaccharide biosynthesis polyprenyl glycosylphosphotransferase n=1 Tax=Patulibacter minatonensis TaxID=298163 RepID=UPI0006860B9B|nr:exopolysaccharide biosynthesis polyprenyl glycosylphosphotransferase [Patulibacter minatonensis]
MSAVQSPLPGPPVRSLQLVGGGGLAEERVAPERFRRRLIRGRVRKIALVSADLTALGVAFVAVEVLGLGVRTSGTLSLVALAPIWLLVFQMYGLYPRHPRFVTTSTLNELPQSFHATLVAGMLSAAWLGLTGGDHLRWTVGALLVGGIVVLPIARSAVRHLLTSVLGPERILLVGGGTITKTVERSLGLRRDVDVAGFEPLPARWARDPRTDESMAHVPRDLSSVVREGRIDRILLSTRDLRDSSLAEFHDWARTNVVSLTVLPEHFDVVGVGATVDQVQGVPVVSLQPPTLSRTSRWLKRCLDVVGAGLGLLALLPLALIIVTAIKLDSRGPVFFRQQRIGRGGRNFGVFKFRTMVPDADAMVEGLMKHSSDPHWLQLESDPRITRVGRLLRATSLDELPQLLNVLVGHMSLVGPRPLSLRDDALIDGWGRGRLNLTPGLTGLWQVLGRKSVPFEDMVKLDYLYVNNWSLWGDVKLLLQTLPAVVSGRGAR